jgi:hypothetical protein
MSRKHFQALADEISKIEDKWARAAAFNAVAAACESFNPLFDRVIFQRACGVI